MRSDVPADARLEIKFAAYESEADRLRHWLKLHPAGFRSPFPIRRVNNLYFDSFDCIAYSDNISGASARRKVRYRWYGEHDFPDKGALEIKCKRNYFGWKLKYRLTQPPYADGARWWDIIASMTRQSGPEGKFWLDANPFPILINRYRREYYVTRDEKVRVTIDTRQTVFDQRYRPYPNVARAANIPRTLVMEFKFARGDAELANQVMQRVPIRVSRNSKYIQGLKSSSSF